MNPFRCCCENTSPFKIFAFSLTRLQPSGYVRLRWGSNKSRLFRRGGTPVVSAEQAAC